MSVSLEVIGCGDAFASGGRFHTSFFVRHPGRPFLIDCGASTPTALQQRRIQAADVTLIAVSHLHGDHFGGLPFLLMDAAYNRPRTEPLSIVGPAGIEARVLAALDVLYPGTRRAVSKVPVRFCELEPRKTFDADGVQITAIPVDHSSKTACFALRVAVDGKVIAYSGDTEWTPALVEASAGADLFVCECTGWDTPLYSHISHAELCAHAEELHGVRMVLVHLGPEMLAHCAESRWPCAEDGMVIQL
jgi:ribonuclease BN (tRNA processing enzyme)